MIGWSMAKRKVLSVCIHNSTAVRWLRSSCENWPDRHWKNRKVSYGIKIRYQMSRTRFRERRNHATDSCQFFYQCSHWGSRLKPEDRELLYFLFYERSNVRRNRKKIFVRCIKQHKAGNFLPRVNFLVYCKTFSKILLYFIEVLDRKRVTDHLCC